MGGKRYILKPGKKFTRLTVLTDNLDGTAYCQCSCGTQRSYRKVDLKRGATRSCGCWNTDRIKKHGMENSSTYDCWAAMLYRCRTPSCELYNEYGGRGITVCARWYDFKKFFADMGEKPDGYTIERINNDGNYKPSNCRWATHKEQMRNRRVTLRTMYGGKMTAISEVAEIHGVGRKRLAARLARGIPLEKALLKEKFTRWNK